MDKKLRGIAFDKVLAEFGDRANSYEELFEKINTLVEENKIRPNKASGHNALNPPLYKTYFINKNNDYLEKYKMELNFGLNLSILPSFYNKNLSIYEKEREAVLKLNEFLNTKSELLQNQVSENVRSYEIWSDEKFIESGLGKTVIKHCADSDDDNVYLKYLNVYPTNEPLSYFSISKDIGQNILIVENLEPFFTIRKIFREFGQVKILNFDISTIIYGSGNHIQSSFREFEDFPDYLNNSKNRIYYFGDLDYSGIGIFESLCARYPDYEIEPFVYAYRFMLHKAKENGGLSNLKRTKEAQLNKRLTGHFFSFFDSEDVSKIEEILKNKLYIPQEIISINDYTGR